MADSQDAELRAWQQSVAEQSRQFQLAVSELRHTFVAPPVPSPLSWGVVRTLLLLSAGIALLLAMVHWWGMSDTSVVSLGRMKVRDQLLDHEHRLKLLERGAGTRVPPGK